MRGIFSFRHSFLNSRLNLALIVTLLPLLAAACGAPAGLLRPNGVAVMPDGSLYIMDRGNYRLVHLAADGRFLGAFGQLGLAPEQIFAGWDLASDAAGLLYICHQARDQNGLLIYDGAKVFGEGKLVREIGRVDYTMEEEVHLPYGLDVDAAGRVYLADNNADTLRVFDAQGQWLATFSGEQISVDGVFWGLNDVAVDDQRGLLYLSEYINARVQQFSLTVDAAGQISLTHRLTIGSYGTAPGYFSYPQYLALDEARGRLYVNDMANFRVQAFDPEGNWLFQFAPPGVESWQGMGLAVGPDGAVYIADALNNVVWAFEPDGRLRARLTGQ